MALSHNLHTVFSWLNLHDVQFLEIKSLHWSYITGLPVYIFIFWHVEEIIFHQPAVKRHLYSVNFRWKHYSNRWMGGKNNFKQYTYIHGTWFQWFLPIILGGVLYIFPWLGGFMLRCPSQRLAACPAYEQEFFCTHLRLGLCRLTSECSVKLHLE